MKIRYIIPCDNEMGNEEVIVTRKEAIELQKQLVAKIKPDFVYRNDEEALEDYITVNWAEIIDN